MALLGSDWGEADVLAGGTDLISLMKEYLHTPKRVVNIKGIKELGGIHQSTARTAHRRDGHVRRAGVERDDPRTEYPALVQRGAWASPVRRSATWAPSAAISASARAAGISAAASACSP